jgi:beta-lactam-binding protein with PASTA domain
VDGDRRNVCLMVERLADRVKVPDVVGLPFHVGCDIAAEAGVTLANPDPDGPPIAALTWPGLFYITSQSPAAGAIVHRWDSVAVETTPYGEADSDAAASSTKPPSTGIAHASPERNFFTDLTGEDEPTA